MKLIYKSLIAIIMVTLLCAQNIIYASMADYTDEQADNKQKQEQQEWKKEQDERIGKSSNNYLKSILVKNYEYTPVFDKQTINYEITQEITDNYIEIDVETDDEKSSVSGTGKIELKSGENDIRIDVTAENGAVRTYFIKAICTAQNASEKKEKEEELELHEEKIAQIQSEDAQNKLNNKNNLIIIILAIIVTILIIVIIIKGKKNGKNKGKH